MAKDKNVRRVERIRAEASRVRSGGAITREDRAWLARQLDAYAHTIVMRGKAAA